MLKARNKDATMLRRWKRVWLPLALIGALSLATGAVAVAAGADNGAAKSGESTAKVVDKSDFTPAAMAAWPAEKESAWNEGVAEKAAWLEQNCGIAVEITEVTPGVNQIVWTDQLKSALSDLKPAGK
jgi:hypothetical protein